MSPAPREARGADAQENKTQTFPLWPLPLPWPSGAQRKNKGATVQRRQDPESQVVAGWASCAGGQQEERLRGDTGDAVGDRWLGEGGVGLRLGGQLRATRHQGGQGAMGSVSGVDAGWGSRWRTRPEWGRCGYGTGQRVGDRRNRAWG